jgi:hypothetical protein
MFDDSYSRRIFVGAVLALIPLKAAAQFSLPKGAGDLLGRVSQSGAGRGAGGGAGALSENQIGLGLTDALTVGARRVIGRVGKTGGYSNDPAIRIPLPGPIERIRQPLSMMGAGGLLDDLDLKMNRGAEQAAPKALDIFVDAASAMSFQDARAILAGPQDSATQYFRHATSGALTREFHPIVDSALTGAGAVSLFKSVQGRASKIPFAGQSISGFDLTDFTVGKALDGLFHYLAVEEGAIRSNQAARSTQLLKQVFG